MTITTKFENVYINEFPNYMYRLDFTLSVESFVGLYLDFTENKTYVRPASDNNEGKYGYSPIGAVVGATYPEEAVTLRKMMRESYFLVPGYGAQGGGAKDILPCFNEDGLGAVINSSRGSLYTNMSDEEREKCTRQEYLQGVKNATLSMKNEIYTALKENYLNMVY